MTINHVYQVGDRVRNVAAILSDDDLGTLGTVIQINNSLWGTLTIEVNFDHAPPVSVSGSAKWDMGPDEITPAWVVT